MSVSVRSRVQSSQRCDELDISEIGFDCKTFFRFFFRKEDFTTDVRRHKHCVSTRFAMQLSLTNS